MTDRDQRPRTTEQDDRPRTTDVSTLPEHYDPGRVENRVHRRWDRTDAHEYVREKRSGGDPFYFVDGPPFTTGRMHVGNAWGKLLKDALLRYHRMQGRDVYARPGYDTHGLPVEVKVEDRHDFETKGDVEAYGLESFVDECREYAAQQHRRMTEEFRDLGVWMAFDDAYRTYDPDYVEAVWAAFARLYEDGHVAREKRVVNTCPRCETALADSELAYEERSTEAAYVAFELGEGPALVAWTTTPWTVVGNAFLAVDRDAEYARVDLDGREAYVAADCVEGLAADLNRSVEVLDRVPGAELVGRRYDHPLAHRVPDHPVPAGEVVGADYVDAEKTGVVHSAPGLGHEDFERGRELGVEPFSPVAEDGTFTDRAGAYAGRDVREAVEAVLSDLDEVGALVGTETHVHEYPQCPRCDADVLYRASEQWLVTVTDCKDRLHAALDDVDYHPRAARDDRLRAVLEEAPDWNVSRQRYWGSPLPVWECADCGEATAVGSREQLVERSDLKAAPSDLHRPAVDGVVVDCPACGGPAERVEDVLDVWFDSAVASWASLDALPGEDPDPWPADLVVEGHDQTRGWFLMQLYLGVLLDDRAAYEEVLMHGFATLDGEPMSKSRGHVLRPTEVVEEYGRDALRARLLAHDQQGRDANFTGDLSGVAEMRDRLDVVWNTVRFATTYMAQDGHDPVPELAATGGSRSTRSGSDDPAELSALDRWVLSRLDATVGAATDALRERRPSDALETTLEFLVGDVSRYYVQSVRERVWTPGEDPDKRAAYDVLGTVLHAGVRLLAPFVPFLAERLYGALGGAEPTVHATDWPTPVDARDAALEERVERLRAVESAVARARQAADRKHRWPVREVVVEADADVRDAVRRHEDHLLDRLNARSVRTTDGFDARRRRAVPEMSALGPAFGEATPEVADAVEGASPAELPLPVDAEEGPPAVTREMVSVRTLPPEGYESAGFDGGTVYVDVRTTPELRREGLANDVVRRLQRLRSSAGLELDQRVLVGVEADPDVVERAVRDHRESLLEAVRGVELVEESLAHADVCTLAGGRVEVSLAPVDSPPASDPTPQ